MIKSHIDNKKIHFPRSGNYVDHTQLSQTAAKNVLAVSGQRLAKAHNEIHETSLDTKQ